MFTNPFISIVTTAKTITAVTNVPNSISDIIIIKPLVERPKRFIKKVTKSRDARDEKDVKNKRDAKDDYEKSIS